MEPLKIAMFSFGDIDNYGDIMFAHVFGMEMRKRSASFTIDFYSPTAASVAGIEYRPYTRDQVDGRYDALVLAGGEVVHFFDDRTWRPLYAKLNARVESERPSDVVWDWVDCAAPFKAWISVGVRPFEDQLDQQKLERALEHLDLVSVRGVLSKKILEAGTWNSYDRRITLSPDLGWVFPRFLESVGESGVHHARLTGGVQQYVLYQVNTITEQEAIIISDQLRQFQNEQGVKVFLLPVIHPWEDVKYLRMIASHSNGELEVLPDRLGILEMADLMVHAKLVLCSSLHTAITALAAGVPAGVINKWQGTKLQDLFGHQFRTEFLVNEHDRTLASLSLLWQEAADTSALKAYAKFMELAVDKTFDTLVRNITGTKVAG